MGVLDDLSEYRIVRRVHSRVRDVLVRKNEGVGNVGELLVWNVFGRVLVWNSLPSSKPAAGYFRVWPMGRLNVGEICERAEDGRRSKAKTGARTHRDIRKVVRLGSETFRSVGAIDMSTTTSVRPKAGVRRTKGVGELGESKEQERRSNRESDHSEWWSVLERGPKERRGRRKESLAIERLDSFK